MDKYRRNDDENDDIDDRRGETYPGLTIINSKGTGEQPLKVFGGSLDPLSIRIKKAKGLLSPQELRVFKYVIEKGYSLSKTARIMDVQRQTIQYYWSKVRSKLNDI